MCNGLLDLRASTLMIEHTTDPALDVEGVGAGPFLVALRVSPSERLRLEQRMQRDGIPLEDRTDHTTYVRDPEGNRVGFSHYPEPMTSDGKQ